MNKYNPDKTGTHQNYSINAEKKAHDDGSCFDGGHFKVHKKEDMEALVEMLRKLGFSLQVMRNTETDIIDEIFPSEKE